MTRLRCAIYTRKSSEEGLHQDFNSLHAQREACEAYIKSQAGEGWAAVKTHYDDGGFSGGSMDRPSLKVLMADVEAGRVDVVVVYKVDRLTRSLADFSKIVDAFDRKGVSFVSVTQAFNTTTSMGRLTLNVLLSFAQFEREVTGERIRDKVAASKAKGMWMGGHPALGYDAQDRKLVVNPAEAETVRTIFSRYLELDSVHALKLELAAQNARTKQRITKAGAVIGGYAFSRGALFQVLKNRLYLGEIVHRDQIHPGQHLPIVDRELFDAVQLKLKAAAATRGSNSNATGAILKGRIFDQDGQPMSPAIAYGHGGKSFRYYVSAPLQQGERRSKDDDAVRRISAPQIEALVAERLERLAPLTLTDVRRVEIRAKAVHLLLMANGLARSHGPVPRMVSQLASKLATDDQLQVEGADAIRLVVAVRPVFRGGRTWLINPGGALATAKADIDRKLLAGLRKAHGMLADHGASPLAPPEELVQARCPVDSYNRRLTQLAFLAPDIQRAIFEGRQPPGLTLQQILDRGVPTAWADQRAQFGFATKSRAVPTNG